MAHSLHISRPIGFPEELQDAKALRRMASDRINMAMRIIEAGEGNEVHSLLLDSESFIEAADAVADGESIETRGAGLEPSVSVIRDHVRTLRYAIGGHSDDIGEQSARALDEMAYGIERALDPLADTQQEESSAFMDRYVEEQKAEREVEKEFGECWGTFGAALEVRLGEDIARGLSRELQENPDRVISAIENLVSDGQTQEDE